MGLTKSESKRILVSIFKKLAATLRSKDDPQDVLEQIKEHILMADLIVASTEDKKKKNKKRKLNKAKEVEGVDDKVTEKVSDSDETSSVEQAEEDASVA